MAGYIHDVSTFIDEHPGGRHLLVKHIGKDASTAFFGGVYDHSNAAHNVRLYALFDFTSCLINFGIATLHDAGRYSSRWCTAWS